MAYFGAPVGLSSSWSGSCSWSGCQAPAQAPQYYPLPPPAPPAQYYPPQSPPPQYAGSNWFDVHPIFWVFIIFIALKLYYTDFYWVSKHQTLSLLPAPSADRLAHQFIQAIQHLPNPYLAQLVVAPIWNTQANQNQQKDDSKKNQNQNQQKDENKKDKNQNQQKDENKKDKIQDQQKNQNQKDNDKDQQKNENKSKDNKSNTVIVRPVSRRRSNLALCW